MARAAGAGAEHAGNKWWGRRTVSAHTPITIDARVDAAEGPGLIAAGEQLSECLGLAAGEEGWPVKLSFRAPGDKLAASPVPSAVIVSLLPDVGQLDEPTIETEARWRVYLDRLQSSGAPVFVRTVFRHVSDRGREGVTSPVLERIRRLNRIAVGLSHEFGVAVIDVDRVLADLGGRALKTDYRLAGALAAEVSGHTTVTSLLSFGLDGAIDPNLQQKAKEILGDLRKIDVFINRRLRRRSEAARQPATEG
jgi:hypothetical protein